MKSATDLLLNKTSEVIWRRGEAYANGHKVSLLKRDEKETEAVAKGTKPYTVHLKFAGSGMSRSCTCPYQGMSVNTWWPPLLCGMNGVG